MYHQDSELPVTSDNGLYSHTTHCRHHNTTTQQLPPPIYSTLAEGGAPADYSVITEKERLAGYTMINVLDKTCHPGALQHCRPFPLQVGQYLMCCWSVLLF